jgi:hypothetical protein
MVRTAIQNARSQWWRTALSASSVRRHEFFTLSWTDSTEVPGTNGFTACPASNM